MLKDKSRHSAHFRDWMRKFITDLTHEASEGQRAVYSAVAVISGNKAAWGANAEAISSPGGIKASATRRGGVAAGTPGTPSGGLRKASTPVRESKDSVPWGGAAAGTPGAPSGGLPEWDEADTKDGTTARSYDTLGLVMSKEVRQKLSDLRTTRQGKPSTPVPASEDVAPWGGAAAGTPGAPLDGLPESDLFLLTLCSYGDQGYELILPDEHTTPLRGVV